MHFASRAMVALKEIEANGQAISQCRKYAASRRLASCFSVLHLEGELHFLISSKGHNTSERMSPRFAAEWRQHDSNEPDQKCVPTAAKSASRRHRRGRGHGTANGDKRRQRASGFDIHDGAIKENLAWQR